MNAEEPSYKPHLGVFIYKMASIAAIGGIIMGFDTIIVSTAIKFLQYNSNMEPWSNAWKVLILSVILGGAAIGALVAGFVADYHGRRKVIMYADIVNVIGAVICCASFSKWMLSVGVIFLGVATGMSAHSAPLYISESCPSYLRGQFLTSFQVAIVIGNIIAYAISGLCSYIDPVYIGWRLMFAFATVPSILQFIGYWYLPETPRFAFESNGVDTCEKIFEKIYEKNEEWIIYEIQQLRAAQVRAETNKNLHKDANVLYRVFFTPHVRRALIIGCLFQGFQQFSGINTILYFTTALFQSAGIQGNQVSMWLSALPSMVNLICVFIPLYLIEVKGRRTLLIASVTGTGISLLLMGFSFLMMSKTSAAVRQQLISRRVDPWTNTSVENFDVCNDYANCDICVTDERCGFCARHGDESQIGYCLPSDLENPGIKSETGFCATRPKSDGLHHVNVTQGNIVFNTKYNWGANYCQTPYAALPIVIATFYLCCFASGYAPLPWVMNSEFYPFWARATCLGFSTFTNWSIDLIVNLSYIALSLAVTRYGLFFIYAGATFIGLIFFIFMIPETKDVSIANVELLFMDEDERMKSHVDLNQDPHMRKMLDETLERIKRF